MIAGSRVKGGALAAAAIAAVAVPSIALAASPKKGGAYVGKQVEFLVAKNGKSLAMSGTGYCATKPWEIKKVPIKNGKFSYSGSTSTPTSKKASVKGTFTTTKKASGTVQVGSCAKASFTAKLSHSGQG